MHHLSINSVSLWVPMFESFKDLYCFRAVFIESGFNSLIMHVLHSIQKRLHRELGEGVVNRGLIANFVPGSSNNLI